MSDHELTVLGSTVREPIEHVEVFPAPPDLTEVSLTSEEVSSMCPVTSQPDLSSVEITYQPGEWCVETKSLKLYLWGFRDRPLFAEAHGRRDRRRGHVHGSADGGHRARDAAASRRDRDRRDVSDGTRG